MVGVVLVRNRIRADRNWSAERSSLRASACEFETRHAMRILGEGTWSSHEEWKFWTERSLYMHGQNVI